jgi:N-methylhydantoinase A
LYTIAVDIGGTFTDVFVTEDSSGRSFAGKALTTQGDLQRGVMDGLASAAEHARVGVGDLLAGAKRFVHATTQSTNAIFGFTGAKTAVLATRGFGDTLTIMRATGRVAGLSVFERHHYRATQKPKLLVDERDIFEIVERIDYKGEVVTPLDEEGIRAAIREIVRRGYRAVAVGFLFSHKNPAHERRVREILREEAASLYVSLSSDVAPVIGEYERSATALFNAYVGPVIEGYLVRLESALRDAGLRQKLLIVQSNGGLATAAQTVPILTVESGPAAGVVGAAALAGRLGYKNVIATDVGGTTFKVAVIENGRWGYSKETVLNQYQLRLPMIDVASIGSGGGSIAWVDGPRLRIGPQSASADPGPACYGQGGTEPTVTDADVVLGYLSPKSFLGGRMRLDRALAERAIDERVAKPLFGGDVLAAAAGIRTVVDSQMADLIRKSTLERGYDPRDFVMMAYGGAGPCHAASYGTDIGMREIIVPFHATVHSAYGAALSDVRFSLTHSDPMVLPAYPATIEAIYHEMEAHGGALLADADIAAERRAFHRWVEARFRRQVHTLRIAVPAEIDAVTIGKIAPAFEAEYERLFGPGSALSDAGVELLTFGVDAVGSVPKGDPEVAPGSGKAAPVDRRPAWCPRAKRMIETPVYDGPALASGTRIAGPAIIEHPGTTIIVLDGQQAEIDQWLNPRITPNATERSAVHA